MPEANGRIRAVLFDLDDTLISWANPTVTRDEYYQPRIERVYTHLCEAGHVLPPRQEFWELIDQAITVMWAEAKETWRITSYDRLLEGIFAELGLVTGQIDFDHLLRIFDWQPWPGVVPFPDAAPVLRALRQQGLALGLLTNSFLPMWMRDEELRSFGLLEFFDERVSAASSGYLKPHPAIYYELLERMAIKPEAALFVGDRPANDIAGANEVGLISVLITPPYLNRELAEVVPDYTIDNLEQLLPLVAGLQGGM